MSITARIQAIAARAATGYRVRHPIQSNVSEGHEATPESIGEARDTAGRFAARLRELAAARGAMDEAIQLDRQAAGSDLAGMVARGEELPDIDGIAAGRRKAALKVKALWQLASREAGGAARAVQLVRAAAASEAKAAEQEARAWVLDSLPKAFELPASVASAARPVLEAGALVHAAARAPSLRTVKAELFGRALPQYRTEPLPERPAILPPDALDPEQAAREIEETLAVHADAIRHRLTLARQRSAKPDRP